MTFYDINYYELSNSTLLNATCCICVNRGTNSFLKKQLEGSSGSRFEIEKLRQSLAVKISSCEELGKNVSILETRVKNSEDRLKTSEAALASERSKNAELFRRVTELETERASFQARWTDLKNSIQ